MPFEWETKSIITKIKLIRVTTKCIKEICTYEGTIQNKKGYLLLSDAKTSVVLKLDNNGNIIKRSFLTFSKDEEICEYASSMTLEKLEYSVTNKKVPYSFSLEEEVFIKNYLIEAIMHLEDAEELKYIYYLCFNEIKGYSKKKLLKKIKDEEVFNHLNIYNLLNNQTS
jgi:hypothetical protein